MDPKFNLEKQRVQSSLKDFCRQIEKKDFIVSNTLDCWINKFDTWLRNQENKRIPLEENDFMWLLNKWIENHIDGQKAKKKLQVGIVDNKVEYTEINAQINVTRRDAGKVKEPIYNEIQEFLDDWKDSAPTELKTVLQDTGNIWSSIPTEKAFV